MRTKQTHITISVRHAHTHRVLWFGSVYLGDGRFYMSVNCAQTHTVHCINSQMKCYPMMRSSFGLDSTPVAVFSPIRCAVCVCIWHAHTLHSNAYVYPVNLLWNAKRFVYYNSHYTTNKWDVSTKRKIEALLLCVRIHRQAGRQAKQANHTGWDWAQLVFFPFVPSCFYYYFSW